MPPRPRKRNPEASSPPPAELLQGPLDLLVLGALVDGTEHGYGVARRIERKSADALRVEEGSLYPALYRLERQGLIASSPGRSENNRPARFYRLTALGRRQLHLRAQGWARFVEAVARSIRPATPATAGSASHGRRSES
ncbi:MAG TPA: PadR family transcriptional regulator [Thermoanaerobaculia bacterium]|nr:PadR family transcriptional regulator [Thermoanaerobaculia bacterium]